MVIGIDTHCDRVNKEIVVAVAGTHDASFSGYHSFSRAVPQARRKQEQADAVSDAVRELVQSENKELSFVVLALLFNIIIYLFYRLCARIQRTQQIFSTASLHLPRW